MASTGIQYQLIMDKYMRWELLLMKSIFTKKKITTLDFYNEDNYIKIDLIDWDLTSKESVENQLKLILAFI